MYTQLSFLDPPLSTASIVPHPTIKSKFIVTCEICGKTRIIGRSTAWKHRKNGSSLCSPCSKRKSIPSSSECKIIDIHFRKVGGKWMSLVQCPMCGYVFTRSNTKVRAQQKTYCKKCSHIIQRAPLPDNKDCIILDEIVYKEGHHTYAIVKCPICRKSFDKTRHAIRADGHTICLQCSRIIKARYGPDNHRWKGGYRGYYSKNWTIIAETVRDRDGHRCQYPSCSVREGDLDRSIDVHHIVPYIESKDNSLTNLISLCPEHHAWADSAIEASQELFDGILMLMYGPDYH